MKTFLFIPLIAVACLSTAMLRSCRPVPELSTVSISRVVDTRYGHDHDPGTVLSAGVGEPLIEVVRFVIAETSSGDRVIVVGDQTVPNSVIIFQGMSGSDCVFELLHPDATARTSAAAKDILMFPAASRIIDLWGIRMLIIDADPQQIRCRILGDENSSI